MDKEIVVRIADLQAAVELVLGYVADVHGTEIHLERDYFWSIPPEQLYNVYSEPDSFTIGQLSECNTHITGIARDGGPINAFALVWVAEVLRGVGQALVR